MKSESVWTITAVVGIGLISLVAFLVVLNGQHFRVCAALEDAGDAERYTKAITAMDAVVDLGLKLSTTLVGLGAALLIGLKSGLKTTIGVRLLILLAAILFAESALYGVWWRFGVAEVWINNCLTLITHSRMQSRYEAHFYFFISGLMVLGFLVVAATFTIPKKTEADT